MRPQADIDPDIVEAIADALKKAGLQDTRYGNKFKQRLLNKLTGQFEESDLFDLIEDLPLPDEGQTE